MIQAYGSQVELLEKGQIYHEWSGGDVFKYQVIGFAQFALISFFLLPGGFLRVWKQMNYPQLTVVALFYLSTLLQFDGDAAQIATGLAYTLILLCSILLLPLIWYLPSRAIDRAISGSAIVLCVFQVVSVAILGWPHDRYVGWIQPNLFGTTILSAFVLAQFNPGWLMNTIKGVCFFLAVLISSRYCIVGCLAAAFIFQSSFNGFSLRTIVMILAASILVFVVGHFADILALDDPQRGLASGFSGREDVWSIALNAITQHPLGAGFKRSDVGLAGHNGYLKVIFEFGVLGGAILIASVLWLTLLAVIDAYFFRGNARQRRFASARAGGLVAFVIAAFFQPQLFNIGDAVGISFLLLLFGQRATLMYSEVAGGTAIGALQPRQSPAGAHGLGSG